MNEKYLDFFFILFYKDYHQDSNLNLRGQVTLNISPFPSIFIESSYTQPTQVKSGSIIGIFIHRIFSL
jgi:hypothetical protein